MKDIYDFIQQGIPETDEKVSKFKLKLLVHSGEIQ